MTTFDIDPITEDWPMPEVRKFEASPEAKREFAFQAALERDAAQRRAGIAAWWRGVACELRLWGALGARWLP